MYCNRQALIERAVIAQLNIVAHFQELDPAVEAVNLGFDTAHGVAGH